MQRFPNYYSGGNYEKMSSKWKWFIAVLCILVGLFLLLLGLGIINFKNSIFAYGKILVVYASFPFFAGGLYLIIYAIFGLKYEKIMAFLGVIIWLSVIFPFHAVFIKDFSLVGLSTFLKDYKLVLILGVLDFVFLIAIANFIYKLFSGKGFLIPQNSSQSQTLNR